MVPLAAEEAAEAVPRQTDWSGPRCSAHVATTDADIDVDSWSDNVDVDVDVVQVVDPTHRQIGNEETTI